MMKRVVFILSFIILSVHLYAQKPVYPTQVNYTNYYLFKNYLGVDSAFLVPVNDTNWKPSRPSIVYRSADSTIYLYNNSRWVALATSAGSVNPNLYLLKANFIDSLNANRQQLSRVGDTVYLTFGGKVNISPDTINTYATKNWVNLQGFLKTETDPVFSASPAATITTIMINGWNGAYDAVSFDTTQKKLYLYKINGAKDSVIINAVSTTNFYPVSASQYVILSGTGKVYGDTLRISVDTTRIATISYVNSQGFVKTETDPVANAKTISVVSGSGIVVYGSPTQTLSINPTWTLKADTGLLATITALNDSTANRKRWDSAFVRGRFDTTTHLLVLYRINNDSASILIPGTSSGTGYINSFGLSRVGDIMTLFANNGVTASISINNSDSLTRLHYSDTLSNVYPYKSNPRHYITRDSLSASAPVTYNATTGVIGVDTTTLATKNYVNNRYTGTAPISVNNSTGVISISQANSTTNGYLSSTDWTTFNSKVGGSGTVSYIPKFTAAGSIGNSQLYDNGTYIGLGTTTPSHKLDISGDLNFTGALFANGAAGTGGQVLQSQGTSSPPIWSNLTGGTGITVSGLNISAQNTSALWNANQLQGIGVSTTAPTSGQLLQYNGTNWVPWTPNYLTSNQTITFTASGDVSGSASGTTSLSPTLTIGNNKVTYAKIQQVSAGKLLGNPAATTGNVQEITVGSGLNLSTGGTLSNTGVLSFNGRFGAVTPATGDYNLSQLGDVNISSPASNQLLQWNGTKWVNWTPNYLTSYTETDPVATAKTVTINAGTGITITGAAQPVGSNPTFTVAANNTSAIWNANQLQGIGVSTTAPTNGQLLQYNGTNWVPWTPNYLTGNQTITLTGDVTGSGTTSIATTLANSGVTAGTYGSSTQVGQFTVDAKGRITSASNVAINFPVTSVNGQTGAVNLGLGNLSNVSLSSPANGQLLQYNGTNWVNWTPNYLPASNINGTTNYVAKFTGTNTLGNSQIFDNGTTVAIGTTSPNSSYKFQVNGKTYFNTGFFGNGSAQTNPSSAVFDYLLEGDFGTDSVTGTYNRRIFTIGAAYYTLSSGVTNNGFINNLFVDATLQNVGSSGMQGTLANQYAGQINFGIFGSNNTGTITNSYGLYINPYRNAGTITNLYQLYLANNGTGTNSWGIYQAGSAYNNYFAGNVFLNTQNNTTLPPSSSSGNLYGYLGSFDTRNTNSGPEAYTWGIIPEFKTGTTMSIPDGATYLGLLTYRIYGYNTDFSGGGTSQIAFTTNNHIYYRRGTSTGTWGSWVQMLTANDLSSGTGITVTPGSTNVSISAQNTSAIWNANQLQGISISSTTPTNGQVLQYNGTSWVPANVSSGTTNYVAKFTSSSTVGNSIIYDNGTQVGISTTTPDSLLTVSGGAHVSNLNIDNALFANGKRLKYTNDSTHTFNISNILSIKDTTLSGSTAYDAKADSVFLITLNKFPPTRSAGLNLETDTGRGNTSTQWGGYIHIEKFAASDTVSYHPPIGLVAYNGVPISGTDSRSNEISDIEIHPTQINLNASGGDVPNGVAVARFITKPTQESAIFNVYTMDISSFNTPYNSSFIHFTPGNAYPGGDLEIRDNGAAVFTGAVMKRLITVTSTGTTVPNYASYVVVNISGGGTITLPNTSSVYNSSWNTTTEITILNKGTSNLTVNAPSGSTINGSSTYTIAGNYGKATFFTDGTNWYVK